MNKKAKKDSKKIVIWIVIALILLFFVFPDFLQLGEQAQEEGVGISVKLYDKFGNEVQPRHPFAIVQGTPGVTYMNLIVSVTAGPAEDIYCRINDLTTTGGNGNATIFKYAMSQCGAFPCTTQQKTVLKSKSSSWTTATQINADSIAGAGFQYNFGASVECWSDIGVGPQSLGNKTANVTVSVESDGSALGSFTVEVRDTSSAEEYCGDGYCNPDLVPAETPLTCAADCSTGVKHTRFRAFGDSYPTDAEIAYTDNCGNTLTAYGYVTKTSVTSKICSTYMTTPNTPCGGSGCTSVSVGLPGVWMSGGAGPTLWKTTSYPDRLLVCDDDGTNVQVKRYSSGTTSNPDKVELQSEVLDTSRESPACD